MQIVWIALKDLLLAARDRSGLLLLLAMPLVLITVLGTAFGGAFATSPVIATFDVGIVDEDGGQLAITLGDILQDESLQKLLNPISLTADEAKELVKAGDLAAAIVIPDGFTADVFGGLAVSLQVWRDPGQQLRPMIVETIARSFVDNLLATRIVVAETISSGQSIAPDAIESLGQQIAGDISKTQVRLQTEAVASGKRVGSFLYYAIGMACMFLLFSGSLCLSSIAGEERRQTKARIMVSPTANVQFLLGKALGQVCLTIAQFAILYLVTRFAFQADWGSPLAVLLLALAYTFAIAGLAMLVAALVPNRGAAVGAWSIGVQIMAALGGSMVPLSQFPAIMLKIAHFSPNYWALRGFLDIAMDLPLPLVNISVLVAIGFLGISLGTWRLARG